MRRHQAHYLDAAELQQEVGRLRAQAVDARSVLALLQREVAQAHGQLADARSTHLLDVNEQLVLSMLRTQAEAEAASRALLALSRTAELDPLTQLPNRALLLDRFAHAIANARRHGTGLALLFLDVNGFKQLNDTFGHAVGDEVLKAVAHDLTASTRASDTVSRYGGDEFLILLSDVLHPADAALIAEKVVAVLALPHRVGARVLQLSVSIGISLFPADGDDPDTLIARADTAMYRAKQRDAAGDVCFAAPTDHAPSPVPMAGPRRREEMEHEFAIAEHERWHVELREANEQLVLAALRAKELQHLAEAARDRLVADLAQARATPRAD